MPELLRSIIVRLRETMGNRRAAPRYATELEAELVLSVARGVAGSKAQAEAAPLTLSGLTRDLSESGLALIVPSIHIGGQYLTTPNRTLEITLKLPVGFVQIRAAAVRYSPLEVGGKNTGYLVGARITEMEEADRARYQAYLQQLATKL